MATGDITATIPNLDGGAVDLLIEGFTTGATWDVGSGAGTALVNLADADATLTLTGNGYNADGTVNSSATYTSRLNAVRRKPYPNDGSEDQDASGSDLDIRFNADRWLWTGYTATLTCAAGIVTNSGGASQTSNSLASASVTNNSTLAPPKVIAQWDLQTSVPAQRVSADFTVGIEAYHHLGIACVEFTATGGTSAHEQTVRVTTKTRRQSANTSLYGEAYEATIPISGFTQGETITINAVVKPNVGAASSVFDSSDTTGVDNEILLRSDLSFTCNKTGALDQYAYVDSGGNDGTGVVSGTPATAEASPYATIKAALDDGANIVRCTTGTHTITAPAVTTADYWVFVEAAPSATVTIQTSGNLLYKTRRLCIRNVTLNTAHFWDGENTERWLWIDGCTVSQTSTTVGFGYRSKGVYITECSGTFADVLSFSSSRVAYVFDGVAFTGFTRSDCTYKMCRCSGDLLLEHKPASNPAPTQDGIIPASFNQMQIADRDDRAITYNGAYDTAIGLAFLGNTIERHGTGSSTSPAVQIYADSGVNSSNNVIWAQNTVIGQRVNFCYNDSGTSSATRSNILWIGNASEDGFNIKGDTFGTPNANRVGNFPTGHGTGVFHNRSFNTTFPSNDSGASAMQGFLGPNTVDYAGGTALGFTDDQSLNSVGNAGDGDYTPDTGSVLLEELPEAYQFTEWDLYGTLLESTADIGAVQRGVATLQLTINPTTAPSIVASGGKLDFGTVANETLAARSIEIENTGNATLKLDLNTATITSTDVVNYFAKGSGSWNDDEDVAPDGTLQLAVTFNAAAATLSPGTYTAVLSIPSNDANSPFTLNLSATIAAAGGGEDTIALGSTIRPRNPYRNRNRIY